MLSNPANMFTENPIKFIILMELPFLNQKKRLTVDKELINDSELEKNKSDIALIRAGVCLF